MNYWHLKSSVQKLPILLKLIPLAFISDDGFYRAMGEASRNAALRNIGDACFCRRLSGWIARSNHAEKSVLIQGRVNEVFLTMFLIVFFVPSFAGRTWNGVWAYDATQTIQCAYILYEPAVMKDPNTGQMSGVVVDLMDEIARRAMVWRSNGRLNQLTPHLQKTWNARMLIWWLCNSLDNGRYRSFWGHQQFHCGIVTGAFVRRGWNQISGSCCFKFWTGHYFWRGWGISGIVAAQDFPKAKILSLPIAMIIRFSWWMWLTARQTLLFLIPISGCCVYGA